MCEARNWVLSFKSGRRGQVWWWAHLSEDTFDSSYQASAASVSLLVRRRISSNNWRPTSGNTSSSWYQEDILIFSHKEGLWGKFLLLLLMIKALVTDWSVCIIEWLTGVGIDNLGRNYHWLEIKKHNLRKEVKGWPIN